MIYFEVLMECNYKYLSIKIGITSILHTWSQKGKYYLHIHMLFTGGGIDKLGRWLDSELVNEEIIQREFKKKFIDELKKLRLNFYSEYSCLNNYDKYIKYLGNIND